jgi:hypothetical protein
MKIDTGGEAILVSTARAKAMLDIGQTKLYALLNAGELKSGKSRKILAASIRDYVARLVAAEHDRAA